MAASKRSDNYQHGFWSNVNPGKRVHKYYVAVTFAVTRGRYHHSISPPCGPCRHCRLSSVCISIEASPEEQPPKLYWTSLTTPPWMRALVTATRLTTPTHSWRTMMTSAQTATAPRRSALLRTAPSNPSPTVSSRASVA